jgi:hypothetical protein
MPLVHAEVVVQAAELDAARPSVPSLFRQTPINTAKPREPTRNEIPAQRRDRRSCDQRQKFELYYDVTADRRSGRPVRAQALAVAV